MKRIVVCLVLSTLAVLLAAPLNAQPNRLRVNVPFDFTVGQTLMPAGQYEVDASIGNAIIRVSSLETGRNVAVAAHRTWTEPIGEAKGILVFQRYGKAYFLSQVISGLSHSAYLFQKSKSEKAIAESAALRVPGEAVYVAAAR